MALTITDWLATHAVHRADVVALVDDDRAVTYAELWRQAVSSSAEFRPGELIFTDEPPSIGHVIRLVGVLAAGAVAAPINLRLTDGEKRAYVVTLQSGERPMADDPELQPAFVFPTGGTTGSPKGAWLTHRATWLWCDACAADGGRSARDVELYFSPFFHVSLLTGLFTTLFAGGTVRLMTSFDAGRALAAIARDRVTRLMGPPTVFEALRRHAQFADTDRAGVRNIIVGSMPPGPNFHATMCAEYPNARIRTGYGATEFGPVTRNEHEDLLAGRIDGVARPVPGARIRIIDADADGIGEIAVSCPWQASGYWGQLAETAATFTAEGIRSGDLGRLDETGWLHVAGRRKEVIVSGGENVYPDEVERVLATHPAVAELIVYGAPDRYWGERVEAAVVLRDGAQLTLEELRAHGAQRLAAYKMPKTMRLLDELPLTPNNKPDRRLLRTLASER